MLAIDSWDFIYRSRDEVSSQSATWVKPQIVSALGSTIEGMFPNLSAAFPLAIDVLKANWARPILVQKRLIRNWISKLAIEGQGRNIFFDLAWSGRQTEGPDFDDYHKMLPPRWKELYRWFESFGITTESFIGLYWQNTPFGLSARLDLDDFRERFSSDKAEALNFAKLIGSDRMRCWMVTDAGDALWLDEERCDKKVYYVKDSHYEDVFVIPEPENLMDRYLAHVLAGGEPAEFDFRR